MFRVSTWKKRESWLAGCCNTPRSESLGWGASEAPWETVSDPPPNSDSRVMSSVEAKLIYQKYDEMMELLRSYRERIYQQWVAGVDKDCHFNLGQPLIQRDPVTNLIRQKAPVWDGGNWASVGVSLQVMLADRAQGTHFHSHVKLQQKSQRQSGFMSPQWSSSGVSAGLQTQPHLVARNSRERWLGMASRGQCWPVCPHEYM